MSLLTRPFFTSPTLKSTFEQSPFQSSSFLVVHFLIVHFELVLFIKIWLKLKNYWIAHKLSNLFDMYFNNLEWRGYFDILTVMYFCVFLIESRSSWLGVSWRFDLRKIRSGQIFFVIIHSNLVSKILKSRKSEKSHPNPFLSVRVLFWYNRPDGTEWTISSVIKLIPPIIQSMIVLYYDQLSGWLIIMTQ